MRRRNWMNGGVKNLSLHSLLLLNGCDLWSHRRNSGISFYWGRQGFGRIGGYPQKGEKLWIWSKLPMCIYIYICIYTHYPLILWWFSKWNRSESPGVFDMFFCAPKKCPAQGVDQLAECIRKIKDDPTVLGLRLLGRSLLGVGNWP